MLMRKLIIVIVLLVAAVGGTLYYRSGASATSAASPNATPGMAAGRGGAPGGAGRGMARPPMNVELVAASRQDVASSMMVTGNLIGAATVEALPKVAGRLGTVNVRLGDRVNRSQQLAKIEDGEIIQQVNQAEAAFKVSAATVRQREADLRYAETNLNRSKSLADRQLMSQQNLDDADSKYQAAVAQLDLARAQYDQNKSRVEELHINLANTVIASPVNGYVAKRALDPGAWVTTNSSFISIVDIDVVRIVANVAEKELPNVSVGTEAKVRVDAYPDETFTGRVTRVAPVLDPATRTAQMEVEIQNDAHRLKPGMYARVEFTTQRHDKAVVVPTAAVVNVQGQDGVFFPGEGNVAKFRAVSLGIEQGEVREVVNGIKEGENVITTGAGALQEGDPILLPGQQAPAGGGGAGRGRGRQSADARPGGGGRGQ
jgi:membrane fusion protein, multidrug efflux system